MYTVANFSLHICFTLLGLILTVLKDFLTIISKKAKSFFSNPGMWCEKLRNKVPPGLRTLFIEMKKSSCVSAIHKHSDAITTSYNHPFRGANNCETSCPHVCSCHWEISSQCDYTSTYLSNYKCASNDV